MSRPDDLDRGYLEDYERREKDYYARFVKNILEGKFIIGKDESPYKERYIKLQRPVAELHRSNEKPFRENIWSQIPFSGSSILALPAFSKQEFEATYFETKDIPKIIDFIKETGRLQFALSDNIMSYEGLDYLDPIFAELEPPAYHLTPLGVFASETEIRSAINAFHTLAGINFTRFLDSQSQRFLLSQHISQEVYEGAMMTYATLKVTKNFMAEEVENLLLDDPRQAVALLNLANIFIEIPACNLLTDSQNFPLDRIREATKLPDNSKLKQIHFDHEIGKFLVKKLTYAPLGLDACKELMYNYDKYDLRRVQESLNQAILANHPDIVVNKSYEVSEILENVWSDKTIPRKVKGLKFGILLSMAAIGSVAAGPVGAAGGLLVGLGFDVANQMIDMKTDGLSEKLAKIKTKSYQANIYDFKTKYRYRLVLDS